jgi:hypothetical protein
LPGGDTDGFSRGSSETGSQSFFLLYNTDSGAGGSGLDYTTYGLWSWNTYDTDTGEILTSRVTAVNFGFPTGASSMPSTGIAAYNGTMTGRLSDSLSSTQSVTGTANLMVDFSTSDVSLNMTNMTIQGQMFRNLSGAGSITNNTFVDTNNRFIGGFTGTLATDPIQPGQIGPDMSGTVQGNFYGPSANEVGGVFEMDGGGAVMNGAFVGSQ